MLQLEHKHRRNTPVFHPLHCFQQCNVQKTRGFRRCSIPECLVLNEYFYSLSDKSARIQFQQHARLELFRCSSRNLQYCHSIPPSPTANNIDHIKYVFSIIRRRYGFLFSDLFQNSNCFFAISFISESVTLNILLRTSFLFVRYLLRKEIIRLEILTLARDTCFWSYRILEQISSDSTMILCFLNALLKIKSFLHQYMNLVEY